MDVSYKKLWKPLIDSAAKIAKLGRNQNVTTTILAKIFTALDCNVADVMYIVSNAKARRRRLGGFIK